MTQKAQVLALLKRGCTTLSQRAGDLRKEGHKIESERVPGKSYHRYRVAK